MQRKRELEKLIALAEKHLPIAHQALADPPAAVVKHPAVMRLSELKKFLR